MGKVILIMVTRAAEIAPGSKLPKQVLLLAAVVLLALGLTTSSAQAATITLGLDFEFSGGTQPSSATTPWVTTTFDDSFGGANTVRLTMSAANLTGGKNGEALAFLFLNFDPTLDSSNLTLTVVDNSASIPNSITVGNNLFMANGDGLFDIAFNFPQPPGQGVGRFTGGETVIYDITFTSPIDIFSFLYNSELGGGQGAFLVAAQIQKTGDGSESGWIGATVIPEPGSATLLGLGITALGLKRRRASR